MTNEPMLAGQRILVVEDDYYLATDTVRALEEAGAAVAGPCAAGADAAAVIASAPVTGAVLDINLRDGRSFDLARALRADGTPFLFITGYDEEIIPADLEGVPRLQKPVELRRVVAALARAVAGGHAGFRAVLPRES